MHKLCKALQSSSAHLQLCRAPSKGTLQRQSLSFSQLQHCHQSLAFEIAHLQILDLKIFKFPTHRSRFVWLSLQTWKRFWKDF